MEPKAVLAIGPAAVLVGGLSTNVPTYLAAALLLGVYFAMQPGTFGAVVYDTVLEETGTSERFESVVDQAALPRACPSCSARSPAIFSPPSPQHGPVGMHRLLDQRRQPRWQQKIM